MPEVRIRKRITLVEEIFHEGGPVANTPLRRGTIGAVIHNPFAGRYEPNIVGFIDDLKPLGLRMAQDLIVALGGDAAVIEGYGKAAMIGEAGEIEHGANVYLLLMPLCHQQKKLPVPAQPSMFP